MTLREQLAEVRQWRENAGLKFKSAKERQLERNIEAAERVNEELRAAEMARVIKPDFSPDAERQIRDAERNDPERMPCCGAPKDGSETTAKYAKRHGRGTDSFGPTETCGPARLCSQRRHNPDAKAEDTTRFEKGPDRMPCCGAPRDGAEASPKWYNRHMKGFFGLDSSEPPCMAAVKCHRLYKQTRVRLG